MSKRWHSTPRQRLDWMLQHLDLYGRREEDRKRIVDAMKQEGLVARSTYWRDVAVDKLASEASVIISRQVPLITDQEQ